MDDTEISAECVTKTLPTLSHTDVEAVLGVLRDIGVSMLSDLVHVREGDLSAVLRPIQIRKLLSAWIQPAGLLLLCLLRFVHSLWYKQNNHWKYSW
jgi:hypothetical protein